MEIIFLGTSAGKPTKKRNVSSLIFKVKNEWNLIDVGEATQHQLLYTKVSLSKIKRIFITHLHGDHIFGLFGLITSRMLDKITSPLDIYAPKGLKTILSSVVDISIEHLGYELNIIEIYPGFEEEFEEFNLKVLPLIHSEVSFAFLIEYEKLNLDSKKLIKDGLLPSKEYKKLKNKEDVIMNEKLYKWEDYLITNKKRVIFAGDNAEVDILGKYLQNLDLLVHEATYTKDVFEKMQTKYLHTTAEDLGKVANFYNVKNLIATHISPRFEGYEILEEIKKFYKNRVFVANDFDKFLLKENLEKSRL
jgi:ribonuclease Z